MGLSENVDPRLLLTINEHTTTNSSGSTVPQQQRGDQVSGESNARGRNTSVFRKKQYWPHILSTRKGIVLKEGKPFLYPKPSVRKEFLLKVKYL